MQQLFHAARRRARRKIFLYRVVHFAQKANIHPQRSKAGTILWEAQRKDRAANMEPISKIWGPLSNYQIDRMRLKTSFILL